ncbi:hypothetical protein HMPREF0101_02864 [Bacteroides fragilis]|nr:hypothetical protein HMPREF0101_02864 [Bacteroides fragilis]
MASVRVEATVCLGWKARLSSAPNPTFPHVHRLSGPMKRMSTKKGRSCQLPPFTVF